MKSDVYQKASILTGLGNTETSHIKLGMNSCGTKSIANSIINGVEERKGILKEIPEKIDKKTDELIKEDTEQFLTFYVGTELFAVKILEVRELIEYSSVTYIPMMQKFIHGVINLRGNVIPVVDLSMRLGRESCLISKRTSIIFVEVDSDKGEINIGILVDAVRAVVDIPLRNIEKAPGFGAKIPPDFIQGIGKINDKFVILLQLQAVLNIADLSKIEEASTIEKKTQKKKDTILEEEISGENNDQVSLNKGR